MDDSEEYAVAIQAVATEHRTRPNRSQATELIDDEVLERPVGHRQLSRRPPRPSTASTSSPGSPFGP